MELEPVKKKPTAGQKRTGSATLVNRKYQAVVELKAGSQALFLTISWASLSLSGPASSLRYRSHAHQKKMFSWLNSLRKNSAKVCRPAGSRRSLSKSAAQPPTRPMSLSGPFSSLVECSMMDS